MTLHIDEGLLIINCKMCLPHEHTTFARLCANCVSVQKQWKSLQGFCRDHIFKVLCLGYCVQLYALCVHKVVT